MMHGKRTLKAFLASASVVALFAVADIPNNEGFAFCNCPADAQFDKSLPLSHPINRCAKEQSNNVSWSSWFTGDSRSRQFHYLDLLELLSRSSDDGNQQKPAS